MSEWYESGSHDGTDCSHCGRERVMVCNAPDGTTRRVCEKCGWDQSTNDYASVENFDELLSSLSVGSKNENR